MMGLLKKMLNDVLKAREPKTIMDILKEIVDEFNELTKTATSLGAYNDNDDAKALKNKISYMRNWLLRPLIMEKLKLKAVRIFNEKIVKLMVEFYKKENFTEYDIRKQIPALREITSEEVNRFK